MAHLQMLYSEWLDQDLVGRIQIKSPPTIFSLELESFIFHCKSTFTVKKKYLWLCQCFIAQCLLIYVKKSSLTFNLYPIRLKLSQSYFILLLMHVILFMIKFKNPEKYFKLLNFRISNCMENPTGFAFKIY